MRAIVGCVDCGIEWANMIDAPTLTELGEMLTSLLVSCHATPPHYTHALKIRFEGTEKIVRAEHEIHIRCLHPKCDADKKELSATVPLEMVGAMTILFHSGHEGHPFSITYGGRTWQSPGSRDPSLQP